MLHCYERAFLHSDETKKLLIMINSILPKRRQKNDEIIYILPEEYQKQDFEKRMKWEQEEEKRWREKQILTVEEKLKQRTKEFYHSYPNFEKLNIKFDTPRNKIISLLYELKCHGTFKNKKALDSAMKRYIKDDIFEELHVTIFSKRSL